MKSNMASRASSSGNDQWASEDTYNLTLSTCISKVPKIVAMGIIHYRLRKTLNKFVLKLYVLKT